MQIETPKIETGIIEELSNFSDINKKIVANDIKNGSADVKISKKELSVSTSLRMSTDVNTLINRYAYKHI